jgi:hypothetical protein
MSELNYEDYRQRLAEVFPTLPVPAKVTSEIADETHEGAADLAQAFAGKPWTLLSSDALDEQAPNLQAFSLEAFRYYLPAFLAEAAHEPEGQAATYAVYALVPLGSYEAFQKNTAALFDAEQARLIAELLQMLQEHPSFATSSEDFGPAIGVWQIRIKEAAR